MSHNRNRLLSENKLAFGLRFLAGFGGVVAVFLAGIFLSPSPQPQDAGFFARLMPGAGEPAASGPESPADEAETAEAEAIRARAKEAQELLKQKLARVHATHLIRRYHDRFTLLDLDAMLETEITVETENPYQPSLASLVPVEVQQSRFHLNMPDFRWTRLDHARPVDAMRLTFRGNGIPRHIEKLAGSKLVEPKLRAFYTAITQSTTTLWKARETIAFTLKTFEGKDYRATSTPFIAIERLAKKDYARMKSAALPYLWRAYAGEESETDSEFSAEMNQNQDSAATLAAEPAEEFQVIVDGIMPGSRPAPLTEADRAENAPPSLLGNEPTAHPPLSVSTLLADAQQLESVFYSGVIAQAEDAAEAERLKEAIVDQRRADDFFQQDPTREYAGRLALHDPEFSALFLVNNLFEQYNLFSVFDKGVSMRINAIDNRLNVVYTSYNLRFVPETAPIPAKILESFGSDTQSVRQCRQEAVHISDEFFLITARPHSYLIRVYLPHCGDSKQPYDEIDRFLRDIRLLDETTHHIKGWLE